MSASILIVEDDAIQLKMLHTLLKRKLDFQSVGAENGKKALDLLKSCHEDICLVILDLHMPVMDGMEALQAIAQTYPGLPVIMLTGNRDLDIAIKALKYGAVDYITKPYEGERMVTTVRNALKISSLSKEVSRLASETEGRFTFDHLIGAEAGLIETIHYGRKAAASDIPVLITGETGTGKEVFAKAIHGESVRSGMPFIAVNCGAIPAQLVESTLFGHEKGAFTGATDKVPGKFREADGGTIFLDEVGELPPETQVKLLRVLQQKEVEPVGAGKPVSVNVRILSATNRDLQKEVERGNFREDLYFRLNVLEMHLPALRKRRSDIIPLAHHFIERYCARQGMLLKTLSDDAHCYLNTYDWPGNVRQLENMMQRAIVMGDSQRIECEDLPHILENDGRENVMNFEKNNEDYYMSEPSNLFISLLDQEQSLKPMKEIEREVMCKALLYFENNVTRTSEALGMAKSTFYRKTKPI